MTSPASELSKIEAEKLVAGAASAEAEARFRVDVRQPARLGRGPRVILVLAMAFAGTIAGGVVGFHAWRGGWFDQERGDMVGGLMMAFDVLVGGLGGLVVFMVLSLLLTRKPRGRSG